MKRKQSTKAAYWTGPRLVCLSKFSHTSSSSNVATVGEISGELTYFQEKVVPGAGGKVQSVEQGIKHNPATDGKGNYVFANISPVFDDIIVERFLRETNTKGLKPVIERVKGLSSKTQPAVSTI